MKFTNNASQNTTLSAITGCNFNDYYDARLAMRYLGKPIYCIHRYVEDGHERIMLEVRIVEEIKNSILMATSMSSMLPCTSTPIVWDGKPVCRALMNKRICWFKGLDIWCQERLAHITDINDELVPASRVFDSDAFCTASRSKAKKVLASLGSKSEPAQMKRVAEEIVVPLEKLFSAKSR